MDGTGRKAVRGDVLISGDDIELVIKAIHVLPVKDE